MNCTLDPCHHLGVGGKTLLEQRFFFLVAGGGSSGDGGDGGNGGFGPVN